jgi:peptidoglycan/LPS O-acetylase OafA/YrhL
MQTTLAVPSRSCPDTVRRQAEGGFLPHINGLRALAVIPVILFHFHLPFSRGGFSGVDVFFVISGYLITGNIVKELRLGHFSLSGFYIKRIRRILPAYFVVLLAVLLLSVRFYSYLSLKTFSWTALSSVFFSTNIRFLLNRDYFSSNAQEDPLLHLWSLSVEEQYYLFIPVFLLAVWRLWPAKIREALSVLLLLSFCATVIQLWSMPSAASLRAAFYLPHLRAWEFLGGAMLATVNWQNKTQPSAKLFGVIGLLLVCLPYVFLSGNTVFPGIAALPSVAGCLLLIAFGNTGFVGAFLSLKPMQFVGHISYSLYLWHWPILVFATYINFGEMNWVNYSLILALSCLVSWLSWMWVEMPFRHLKGRNRSFYYSFALTGCLVMGAFSGLLCLTNGGPSLLNKEANALINEEKYRPLKVWKSVTLWTKDNLVKIESQDLHAANRSVLLPIGKSNAGPTFLLWGDSHAAAILPGFDSIAGRFGKTGYYLNRQSGLSNETHRYYDTVTNWLQTRPDIATVYMIQRWSLRLSDKANRDCLQRLCEKLKQQNKQMVLFTSLPEYPRNPLEYPARRQLLWFVTSPPEPLLTIQQYSEVAAPIMTWFQELKQQYNVVLIPLEYALKRNNQFFTIKDGHYLYSDNNHLSPQGALHVMTYVGEQVFNVTKKGTLQVRH